MKHQFQVIVVILTFASCNSNSGSRTAELEHWNDTVYSEGVKDDPNFYRMTVQITDTTEQKNPSFELGVEETIKIQVWEFDEYPIYIKNEENLTVTKQDTINGIFSLTPLDSNFSIEIWQDYGQDHVFRKTKKSDSIEVTPLNGFNHVASWRWKIK